MQLSHKKIGESGTPVVIAHGLYGCSDNWIVIAKALANNHEVFAVDMRNHGRSPHSKTHSYNEMCEDLFEFINRHKIKRPILIGHSMGGRAVALLAARYPTLISKIVVVDVSPFDCENKKQIADEHKALLEILASINLPFVKSYSDAENLLSEKISDTRLIKFIIKNLQKNDKSAFSWRLNIDVLLKNVNNIVCGSLQKDDAALIKTPTLFVVGEKSQYVSNADISTILTRFENARFAKIAEAGHWLHHEKTDEFIQAVQNFINEENCDK